MTRDEFLRAVKQERNRSYRTGVPVNCVTIDFSKSRHDRQLTKRGLHECLAHTVDVISRNTRNYDIKYLSKYTIAILLCDASSAHARAFIKKIKRILSDGVDASAGAHYPRFIRSVTFACSPLADHSDNGRDPSEAGSLESRNGNEAPQSGDKDEEAAPAAGVDSAEGDPKVRVDTLKTEILPELAEQDRWYRFAKRSIDIVGAVIGISILAVPMLLIAIAIKLTSRGPVLYKQVRVGFQGRMFTFLKFRTMRAGANDEIHRKYQWNFINGRVPVKPLDDAGRPLFKVPDDPRITPLGRVLRRTCLDELPQLFHVLLGTMSLVGPRPPIPYEVDIYQDWHRRRVLEAKPGITGLWQVLRTYNTTFKEMVRYDLNYINNQSIWLDLKIILRTLPVVMNTRFTG
ncbi:MAG TPA: sugar transferase [Vicinamibacteria bacterium]|nr:sugar transferase [Vicinamibacteria bacterium]